FNICRLKLLRWQEHIRNIAALRTTVWGNNIIRGCSDDDSIQNITCPLHKDVRYSFIKLIQTDKPLVFAVTNELGILIEMAPKILRFHNFYANLSAKIG